MSMSKVNTSNTNAVLEEFHRLNPDIPEFQHQERKEIKKQTLSKDEKFFLHTMIFSFIYSIVYSVFLFFAVTKISNAFFGILSIFAIFASANLGKTKFFKSHPALKDIMSASITNVILLFVAPTHFLPLLILNSVLCLFKKARKITSIITDYVLARFLMPIPFALIFAVCVGIVLNAYYKKVIKTTEEYLRRTQTKTI